MLQNLPPVQLAVPVTRCWVDHRVSFAASNVDDVGFITASLSADAACDLTPCWSPIEPSTASLEQETANGERALGGMALETR
jgi:hypothetical protein